MLCQILMSVCFKHAKLCWNYPSWLFLLFIFQYQVGVKVNQQNTKNIYTEYPSLFCKAELDPAHYGASPLRNRARAGTGRQWTSSTEGKQAFSLLFMCTGSQPGFSISTGFPKHWHWNNIFYPTEQPKHQLHISYFLFYAFYFIGVENKKVQPKYG